MSRLTLAAATLAAAALAGTAQAAAPTKTTATTATATPAATAPVITPVGRLPFPERGYVVDLAQGAAISPRQVRVTENGLGVGNFTFQALSSSNVRFGTILAIDASDSMAGKPEAAALAAAQAFVAKRAANQEIGLVAFNSGVDVVQSPTANAGTLQKALAGQPTLRYGTHIYDTLETALTLLAKQKIAAGSIVLLSDGADVGSTSTLAKVVQRAAAQKVRIFTVGLRSGAFDGPALKAIAARTGAAYVEAGSTADLGKIYAALGSRLASEYLLEYRSAVPPKTQVQVAITIAGLGTANTSYAAPTPSQLPPFHRPLWRRFILSWVSLVIVALLVAWFVAFGLRNLLEASRSRVIERVRAFAGEETQSAEKKREEWRRRAGRATASGSQYARGFLGRLEEQLDIGRIPLTATRVVFLTLLATVIAVFILVLVAPVFAIAGLATPLASRAIVKRRVRKVRDDFAEQLPPNLQVLAAALRAGHTLIGALVSTIEHADEPSKSELGRIISDERIGVPLEDAVRRVAARMASRDLEQVALLAELQRTTGGNAAEVLDVIVGTVRERADIRRLVQTLTAQGRMGRWILTALPIVTALSFWALQPDIVGGMWSSSGGQIALLIAAGMVTAGSMVIQRIIDIEV